ncbi:MAG: polysaccharide pyruvyl transferase family protein [Paludibacteraceae bacterium]|nr:polysaccharide pyruvyl transferase family protein [Paludibacteraceae bacterium]
MEKIGIVSFNIYANFTNYGSALQSWAVFNTINRIGKGEYNAVLVDYCPEVHLDKDILNPMKHMFDQDAESQHACEVTLPAIRENYYKFEQFYHRCFNKTETHYNYQNFEQIEKNDGITRFVCGSDTIFCTLEFQGFDDGYFANFPCMRGNAISYAASFGDATFDEVTYPILKERLHNFKALGIRENRFIPYIQENVSVPCQKTIDPTLLLRSEDYDTIAADRIISEKYILLYARRYNHKMFAYVDRLASEKGYKIIDISLRAETLKGEKHEPWYKAGVEEFLSLVKYADFVVTNSFHGLIFSVIYRKQFVVFTREQAGNKIDELLELFGLQHRMMISGDESIADIIDYDSVHRRIDDARENSLEFFKESLSMLKNDK